MNTANTDSLAAPPERATGYSGSSATSFHAARVGDSLPAHPKRWILKVVVDRVEVRDVRDEALPRRQLRRQDASRPLAGPPGQGPMWAEVAKSNRRREPSRRGNRSACSPSTKAKRRSGGRKATPTSGRVTSVIGPEQNQHVLDETINSTQSGEEHAATHVQNRSICWPSPADCICFRRWRWHAPPSPSARTGFH